MHLKSYQIDGLLLRTAAANFSASGLKGQDNDLVAIESGEAAIAAKPRESSLDDPVAWPDPKGFSEMLVIIILLAIIVLAILFPAGIKSAAPWVIVALMLISALLLWIGISAGISGGGF